MKNISTYIIILFILLGLLINYYKYDILNDKYDNILIQLENEENRSHINISNINKEILAFQKLTLKDEIETAKKIVSKNYNVDVKNIYFYGLNEKGEFIIAVDEPFRAIDMFVNIQTNTIIIR